MSYIIVPANRRRQPQAFVGVNPAYSSAYVVDCGRRTIVNRGIRADVTAHDASIGASSEGLAHAYVDNKTFDYPIPSVTIGTGDFTIATYFYHIASVNTYQYIGGTDAVAIAPFVYHTSASNHAGVYVVSVLVDSGYTLGGGLHRMVVRRIGGQVYFNIDNLPRTNVANSTSIGALSKIIVGSYTAGGAYGLYSGSFNYIYALDVTRGWSENEARRFVDNPWCVFANEPRIIYFGAGSGTTTTDAAVAGTQATDVAAIAVEAITGAAIAGTQATDVAAITVEATTGVALAGTQATDVAAVTVEATTGAAIAGTQATDVAAAEVTASTGTGTDAAVAGTQASDVGALEVEATLGLALSGTQASDLGYIVVEATLTASMAGTQASDVAAITVAGQSIWTDVGVSAATWSDVGGATSIWTDL